MGDDKEKQKFKIHLNSFDPRHQPIFKVVTDNISVWRSHSDDRAWWIEQERHCLTLFRKQGYDLQTGLYYCLINGNLYGWPGLASASLLLANAFEHCDPGCWPPHAAKNLRKELIEWYCHEVIDSCYAWSFSEINISDYKKLVNALALMRQQAEALRCQAIHRITSLNTLMGIVYQTQQYRDSMGLKSLPVASENKDTESLLSGYEVLFLESVRWRKYAYSMVCGFLLAVCMATGISGLTRPELALTLNNLIPNNPLSTFWVNKIQHRQPALPSSDSWAVMKASLERLEQNLVEAEQRRRPYLTISELKTSVYQLQHQLHQMGQPVSERAYTLKYRDNRTPGERKDEINDLLSHLDMLKNALYLIEFEKE